jgi:hypothetical protein
MRNVAENILLVFLGVLLLLPGVFTIFANSNRSKLPSAIGALVEKVEDRKLYGMTVPKETVPLNSSTWFNGTFQHGIEGWYRDNFGLRRIVLQLQNQMMYAVLSTSAMYFNNLKIGRNHSLYELSYVYAACNLSPVPADKELAELAGKLVRVQAFFAKHHIPFIFVVAPTKGFTFPEDFPKGFKAVLLSDTSYGKAIHTFTNAGVHLVDGQAKAIALKQRSPELVFPKGGTHWTDLAAAETLTEMMEKANGLADRKNHPLPNIQISNMVVERSPQGVEADLLELLNLYAPDYNYPVPHITIEKGEKTETNVALVGTSFTNSLIELLRRTNIGSVTDYWYYTGTRATFSRGAQGLYEQDIHRADFKGNFLSRDAIFLEAFASNMTGNYIKLFIDDALKYEEDEERQHSSGAGRESP